MRIEQLLQHHGIAKNPFAEEDAQTDPVFKDHCIVSTYHPTWDKVYGDPREPSSAIVFGEKGSGKTAMRLQLARHLEAYNKSQPGKRVYIIHYDDFNPFLDQFKNSLPKRMQRGDKMLAQWKLWDHMDAILAIGVTGLVDRILDVRQPSTSVSCDLDASKVSQLDRHQARDLLLLAACYDQSISETFKGRWDRLRRRLRFGTLKAQWQLALGVTWLAAWIIIIGMFFYYGKADLLKPFWLYLGLSVIGFIPYLLHFWKNFWLTRGILKHLRVGNREPGPLRQVLMNFTPQEISSQPLPNKDSSDDRYELLQKFQALLQSLGFPGIIVLVDRLDEPHLVNGSAELMKALLWPMLDNKFLKHPGLGLKLMLPIELTRFIEREERDFYQRARLDKQNMIPTFEWTGEALYDVASARIKACAAPDASPTLRVLFDASLTDQRIIEGLRSLRVPRRLFKFLFALLTKHCNAYRDDNPQWQISSGMFESVLADQVRDQSAFDRGVGAG